jgi:hypothetical protein
MPKGRILTIAAAAATIATTLVLTSLGATAASAAAAAHGPAPRAAPRAVAVSGQVFDARVLSTPRGASEVIPDGLHRIAGARVSVTFSSGAVVDAVTSRAGYFTVARPAGTPVKTTATVSVQAPGFGTWRETGVPAALPRGNYPILTVLLGRVAHAQAYPRNPSITGRAGPASGRGLPVAPRTAAPSAPAGSARNTASRRNSTTAAGGCEGYFSDELPPSTISVYNVGTGTIQTYDFEYYVENVLPDEWEASWPAASLEAGAMAVKTYGWYWVNNWRGGSLDGTCYDVEGGTYGNTGLIADCDTDYQCFIPGTATGATTDAVEKTWTEVAQRNGAVFEASFNSGYSTDTCGEDDGSTATGSEMSQYGTDACANDGYPWDEIFTTYYFPDVDLVSPTIAESLVTTLAPAAGDGINAFAMSDNGHLYQSYETTNGQFSDWKAVAGSFPGGSLQGSISAFPQPADDDAINLFALGSNAHLYQSYETTNGQFSDWKAVAGSFPGGSLQGSISAFIQPADDDAINLFALGSNAHLYQSYETTNGQFSDWIGIAGTLPT